MTGDVKPEFPGDECQDLGCPEKPQKIVEIETAGDTTVLGLCMLHTAELSRRDPGGKITVIGP